MDGAGEARVRIAAACSLNLVWQCSEERLKPGVWTAGGSGGVGRRPLAPALRTHVWQD
ncbi:hypothetical protein IscW_ISCW021774 [Ixodes scapularis]|uniref:Uncharacterized protein n=1 Tax=Ixodes scapularis TaxID=6945 RepID=B7Q4S2_IXOSC|nr:hypothetical protein IscW_ISCW021774 [Ixodes scapularis]|eukprot:XP_002411610.1 hypothetical protein IscW_ISCW021774 [Ixodes scapularis]